MGHNVLAVVHQNMLKGEIECQAGAFNTFFGINFYGKTYVRE